MGTASLVRRLRTAGCAFAEDEARLLTEAAASPAGLATMVDRRLAGEPLEHILGWVEFDGRRMAVAPGVFVPRRRTEFLVAQAAERMPLRSVVVDLCCGCGAIGAAISHRLPSAQIHAVDVDERALGCAKQNLPASASVYQGDLYAPLPAQLRGRVSVLVANAPYVPTSDLPLMPAEARLHEPQTALDGGVDGLDVQRRIVDGAKSWLARDGRLLIETSGPQASALAKQFRTAGLTARVVRSEEFGATVVIGRREHDAEPTNR